VIMNEETLMVVAKNCAWMGASIALLIKEGMSPNMIEPTLIRMAENEALLKGVSDAPFKPLTKAVVEGVTQAIKDLDKLRCT